MKEFADDNFKFDENGRKFSKRIENIVGKGENPRYKQFLLFPQCLANLLHVKQPVYCNITAKSHEISRSGQFLWNLRYRYLWPKRETYGS